MKKSNFFLIYARKLKNKFETFFENESKITIIEILDLATLEQKDLMNDFLFKLQASLFFSFNGLIAVFSYDCHTR